MFRTLAIAAVLSAALASHASAQATQSENVVGSNVLPTVTVTAKRAQPNVLARAWHMQEDRAQVLAMMDENRRLAAQLRGYDKEVARLEKRLDTVKGEHDRKVAAIAATDSLTAETRRRRLELEAKLRQADSLGAVASASGAAAPERPIKR